MSETKEDLGRRAVAWLIELLSMEGHGFCGMTSGRLYRKREAEALVKSGHLSKLSMVMCDGDGFALEPERERMGYVLTEKGRAVAVALEAADDRE